jgi:hypothetical protein
MIYNKNSIKFNFVITFLLIYVFYEYIVHIGHGSGDDWIEIYNFKTMTFKEYIYSGIQQYTVRPISHLIYAIQFYFLGINELYTNLYVVFLWVLTAILIKVSFRKLINKTFGNFFFIIFLFPFIASSIFASPIYVSHYFWVITFWSISLLLVKNFIKTKKKIYFVLHLIFIALSIFTIETFPALIIITIFYPIILEVKIKKLNLKKNIFYFFKLYILPITLIILFFLISKFYLSFHLSDKYFVYGINLSTSSFLQGFFYFYVIFAETIILTITSIKFIEIEHLIIFLLILYASYLTVKTNNLQNFKFTKYEFLFLLTLFISLFSNSIIFFLSGFPATTYGYYNKLMLTSFLPLSGIFAFLILFLLSKKKYIISSCIIFLCFLSFDIQIKNFVVSEKIRNNLTKMLSEKIINKNNINKNLVVCAPFYHKKNYNNERIFQSSQGYKKFLKIVYNYDFKNVWFVNNDILNDRNYFKGENILNYIDKINEKELFILFCSTDSKLFYLKEYDKKKLILALNEVNKIYITSKNLNERLKNKYLKIIKSIQ